MSVLEMVEEIPKLSEQDLKMLREALEDAEDIADAMKVLADPGECISLDDLIKEHSL
ncbi:MAG: hypothetical protein K2W97_00435 [Chthoniobacterales bacterium]|nr:hypothetical protein [Chthoniobacterales bacterium]